MESGSLLKDKHITRRYEVGVDPAAEEIIKFAEEIEADIVAMSTNARSGISRYASGSIVDSNGNGVINDEVLAKL